MPEWVLYLMWAALLAAWYLCGRADGKRAFAKKFLPSATYAATAERVLQHEGLPLHIGGGGPGDISEIADRVFGLVKSTAPPGAVEDDLRGAVRLAILLAAPLVLLKASEAIDAAVADLERGAHEPQGAEVSLPIHRTAAGWPRCATCDGGGCYDCTDPA